MTSQHFRDLQEQNLKLQNNNFNIKFRPTLRQSQPSEQSVGLSSLETKFTFARPGFLSRVSQKGERVNKVKQMFAQCEGGDE